MFTDKIVTAIMLTLLLTSMLTLAFNIQPAKAASESIIDTHGDSRFTKYPSGPYWWSVADHDVFHTRAYNNNFWYTYCGEEGQGELYFGMWQASLPQSGAYEVFVWIPNPDAFGTYTPTQSAIYQIYYSGGMALQTVNQRLRTGGWYSLGSYTFGASASVILNDRTGEPYLSTMVAFDAIKFVMTSVNQPFTLNNGYVSPSSGDTSTTFSYYVTYSNPEGDAPTLKYVYIDGYPYTMAKISGSYVSGAVFRYSTTLSVGSHHYFFYFEDSVHGHTGSLPASGIYSGPNVTPDFSITSSPTSLTIQQGGSSTSKIIVRSINSFNQPVQLTNSGLPPGVTVALTPQQVTPPAGGSAISTLTVSVDTTTTLGSYTFTVTGTSGVLTHSLDFSLKITVPATISLDPSDNIYTTGDTTVGRRFNVTVWASNVVRTLGVQVFVEFSDSVINVARWFEPRSDPQYIFYGKTTSALATPPDPSYNHTGPSRGRALVSVSLFPCPPTQPLFTGSGKVCIFEFKITAVPTAGKYSSALTIDTANTFLLDENGDEIPGVTKENGYYEIACPSKFKTGDRVRTTAALNVREGPGLGYAVIDTMPEGTLGEILDGPVDADGYIWWDVNYDIGIIGWSAENCLEPASRAPVHQYRSSGLELPVGEKIDESTVIFAGLVSSPNGDLVKLQVELRQLTEYNGQFDDTKGGLKESQFVESGSTATITVEGLWRGSYHWRERTIDEHETPSEWIEFGNNDVKEPDFTVCNKFKIVYPEGWKNLQLFVPLGHSPVGYLDKIKLGLFNRLDMWYKINVSRRVPGGSWEDITDQIWEVPYVGPYSFAGESLLYSPIEGEEIKIELKSPRALFGQDPYLMGYLVVDLAARWFLGICLPPNALSLLSHDRWVQLKAELSEFYDNGIVPFLGEFTFWSLEKFLVAGFKAMSRYRPLLSSLLIDMGLPTAKAAMLVNVVRKIADEAFALYKFVNFAILIKDSWESMISKPQEENVILTVEKRLTSTVAPNLVLTEGLHVAPEGTYLQGDKISAHFTVKNVGLLPINLHGLTVGGRTEEGYVQDFSFRADVTINPAETYSYEGELPLLHDGRNSFFVAAQLEGGEWITNVPTEAGLVNALDVDVEPVLIVVAGYLGSPGELRIYDTQGRVTGSVAGETKCEIPHSFYYDNMITIFSPEDYLTYRVVGTEQGSYDLEIVYSDYGETTTFDANFTAVDIPILNGAIHQYAIDWVALSRGEKGVTVRIDDDGDGDPERTIVSDSELTPEEFMIGLPGDANGDGQVDLKDAYIVAKAFGECEGRPRWDPLADLNEDGKVDLKDYFTVSKNYGRTYP